MNSNIDNVGSQGQARGTAGQAAGNVKEVAGTLVGDQTLEAKGTIQKHLSNPASKNSDAEKHPVYKVVGVYPNFTDMADALDLLEKEGFTEGRISVLGREQEHWQERLGKEWENHKTAKGALVGGALGAVPGLALVAGIALTGGVGLLAAGPMLGALSALGMGSLVGGLMGAGSNAVDVPINVEEEVANAISLGQWVLVVECHSDAEAARAQALLPARRVVWDNKNKARAPTPAAGPVHGADPAARAGHVGSANPAAEQTDLDKLAAIVSEVFSPVTRLTDRPVEEVMSHADQIDSPELKEAVEEAIRKISTATGLHSEQIVDLFKEKRSSNVNIVGALHARGKSHAR
jgi:uncharacterized protein YjbJ (UPF0337 family)